MKLFFKDGIKFYTNWILDEVVFIALKNRHNIRAELLWQ